MPLIHLQTTADLPENAHIPDILAALVEKLSSFETVDSRAVKAYHSLRSVWHMGADAQPGFATCEVSVLAGRPEALRNEIADGMYGVLQNHFRESHEAGEVNLTLEVREMDKPTYRK